MKDEDTITILVIILIIVLLFSILIFPDFSIGEVWAQGESHPSSLMVQAVGGEGMEIPETLEEAKEKGEDIAKEAQEKLPGIMKRIWEEEAKPVWQKMWNWTKSWWENTIWPWVDNIFQERVKPALEEEIEKKRPIIEQEIEKEKQEMTEEAQKQLKEEASAAGKSLWGRFKELLFE